MLKTNSNDNYRNLIKFFEGEGYSIFTYQEYEQSILVYKIDEHKCIIPLLRCFNDGCLDTCTELFEELSKDKQTEYYEVIFEYLMTPPEEREEEEKYYLKRRGIGDKYLIRDNNAGIYYTVAKSSPFPGHHQSQFTQSEIDEMPECFSHPAVWEQIEVKEDNQ